MISIFKTYDRAEADFITAQLESASIPCHYKSDDAGGVLPHLTMMHGIEILVRPEDQTRAKNLLKLD